MPHPLKVICGGAVAILIGCTLQDCNVLPTLAAGLEVMAGIAIFIAFVTLAASCY